MKPMGLSAFGGVSRVLNALLPDLEGYVTALTGRAVEAVNNPCIEQHKLINALSHIWGYSSAGRAVEAVTYPSTIYGKRRSNSFLSGVSFAFHID